MVTADDWLQRVAGIRQHTDGTGRAPHKPLLILYALGRWQGSGSSEVWFADDEERLKQLLVEFGRPGRQPNPQHPFLRLANDGLWVVTTDDGSSPTETVGDLRASGARGRFAPNFDAALREDGLLGVLIARLLLDRGWPESLHEDICDAVGLDLVALEDQAVHRRVKDLEVEKRRRDAAFRERVLVAYEYRCAMCGFDGWLGGQAVGLDAAHVRWWAFDGPDEVSNGVCLCSLHHKLLDRGVMGLTQERRITVSRHFVGRSSAADQLVLSLAGRDLAEPQPGEPAPLAVHVEWHEAQVFKAPARSPF